MVDIKKERLERHMTQQSFADLIGYNVRTVQRWEYEELGMSDLTEKKIKDILKGVDR